MENKMRDYETKYEPKTFNDMVIHDPNNNIMPLLNQIVSAQSCPNLLLFGDFGTGKTTLAKVLTNEFYARYGEDNLTTIVSLVFEKDNTLYKKDQSVFHWSKSNVTWHIFDEIDKCNHKNVYNELHETLQNKHGHKYLLTANRLVDIPKGIQSRAMPIPIDCPTPEEFLPRAMKIVNLENINASSDKVLNVLTAAGRDLRRYYGALERL